ncbi:BadF/BadG/BcrA/BcrD ATPase family protein [Catenuloplanes sp. NPDC051500]|uniref:BadF/BadG/BcrA/BcrD ATPase family protein n=1 Tax=Catenuloplanes sp. NPDC051500 TaxID=3363959 RepID=UPI0037BC3A5C
MSAGSVVGIDVGGSGLRGRAVRGDLVVAELSVPGPVRISGESLAPRVGELVRALAGDARSVAIGCAGVATFGAALRDPLVAAVPQTARVLVCSDLLIAYVGGLGLTAAEVTGDGGAGVVLAAGTGAVAFGGSAAAGWRRADGWGHLLGDDGGGAWIGRAGMRAALRARDGRPGGSAVLLELLLAGVGEPSAVVAELTGRADRAGMMAAFAPAVISAAVRDPVAAAILDRAAGHLADTARAVVRQASADPARAAGDRPSADTAGAAGRLAPTLPSPGVVVVGNLVRPGGGLAARVEEAFRARGLTPGPAAGSPVDGAVVLAATHGAVPGALAAAGALTVHR